MEPLVSFYQLVPGGKQPRRASRDVAGTLPNAAVSYCEPVLAASAYGYHIYAPLRWALRWDGALGYEWSYDIDGTGTGGEWFPIHRNVFFPGFVAWWGEYARPEARPTYLPFLQITEDLGIVQIWTGLLVRTRPGISLIVRTPVNDSRRSLGYEILEGAVSTDTFGGPVPIMMRLLKTGGDIFFQENRPLAQLVPVPREFLSDHVLNDIKVGGIDDMPADRWASFAEWGERIRAPHGPGMYRRNERVRMAEDRRRAARDGDA